MVITRTLYQLEKRASQWLKLHSGPQPNVILNFRPISAAFSNMSNDKNKKKHSKVCVETGLEVTEFLLY